MSDGKTVQPLRVEDIQPSTYLFWVAKYNVENVSPPPPVVIIVSEEIVNKGGEGEMRLVNYKDPQNVTVTTSITNSDGVEVTTVTPPEILKTWVGAGEQTNNNTRRLYPLRGVHQYERFARSSSSNAYRTNTG